ncbi:MAG: hypothetical protein IJP61_00135 [Treponema sp.]|nr:hypothetical protein [Treponema sp.]
MTKEELLNDETFLKEISTMKNVEDVQKAFAAKGVTISVEELKAIKEGKLSTETLDNVAGGLKFGVDLGKYFKFNIET